MRSSLSGGLPSTLGDCNRIRELDGLRGVAIGMVVLFIFSRTPWRFPLGPCFPTYKLGYGSPGPGLICSSCCPDSSLAGFCWIRALRRITTPFSTSGAFSESFPFTSLRCSSFPSWSPWGRGRKQAGSQRLNLDGAPWYAYLTFTQNFWMTHAGTLGCNGLAMTWSLAVEEQFYLTVPLYIRALSRRWLTRFLVIGICSAPLLRILLLRFRD